MSINNAVLGILSTGPMTGYDLKKIMQDSPFMPWSGNNNQIYKALLALHDEGYVAAETVHQAGAPSKKLYTVTASGLAALTRWCAGPPEPPEVKKPFLVQLAWSWLLGSAQVETLLDEYEQTVRDALRLERGRANATPFSPARTPRERAVWALLYENVAETYQLDLAWIQRVRQTLAECPDDTTPPKTENTEMEENAMSYTVVTKGTETYLLVGPEGGQIQTEQDGLSLIALCAQYGTNRLLLRAEALPDAFFSLRTGLAGAITQKLSQYNIRTAVVLDGDRAKGKFKDFMLETNRGNAFRAYDSMQSAEAWLLEG